jgi:hypothetical protein
MSINGFFLCIKWLSYEYAFVPLRTYISAWFSICSSLWQAIWHMADRHSDSWQVTWHVWQRMEWRHVAQSMAATCHPFIGLKLMSLAGVDPATSGQGQRLGKEPPTGAPPLFLVIYMVQYNIYISLYMRVVWGATGPGLSPSPWSHDMLHITHSYIIWMRAHGCNVCSNGYINDPPFGLWPLAYVTGAHVNASAWSHGSYDLALDG